MTTRRVTIKELDAVSLGKLQGAILAAMALALGLILAVAVLVGTLANGYVLRGIFGALAIVLLFPIVYGLAGFVTGLVGGLIYNLTAQTIGGIRLKFTYDEDPL